MKPYRCLVPRCENNEEDGFLKFYELPIKDPEVCKEWIIRIGNPILYFQKELDNTESPKKICEIHFPYTSKTGANSQLHEDSLPTFNLPIVGKKTPNKMNYYFIRPCPPNANKTNQKQGCKENTINLQMEMCSEVCRFCFKKGILYDIEKSKYKTKVEFVTIIQSLVPNYKLNSHTLRENICLDCVKLLLTSYLTLSRIKAAVSIFSVMLEPLTDKSLPKRIVKVSYQHEFNMKLVLFDCNLEISLESKRTYFSEKPDATRESVEVPRPILEKIKEECDTSSIDLPLTFTVEQLSEMTTTSNQLTDIISTRNENAEISSASEDLLTTDQLTSKQTVPSNTILGMTFDKHNFNMPKKPTIYSNACADETSAPLIKILKLDLSKIDPATQRLIKLPTSRLLKRLSGVPNLSNLPKRSTIKMAGTQTVNFTDTSNELTGVTNLSNKQSKTSLTELPISRMTSMSREAGNSSKTAEKATQLTDLPNKQVYLVNKNGRAEMAKPDLVKTTIPNSCGLKQYGNKRKLIAKENYGNNDQNEINGLNDDKNDDFFNNENSTDNCLNQNNNDKVTWMPEARDFRSFQCSIEHCTFFGETLEKYVEHFSMKHKKMPSERTCPQCNAVCIGYEEYYQHCQWHKKVKREQKKSEKTFQCAHCNVVDSNRVHFIRHLRYKHGRNVACPTCHKQVKEAYLIRHIKSHGKIKIIRCDECNLTFDTMKVFNQHLLNHHPKVCLICLRKFSTIGNLRLHIMKKHNVSKEEFECEFCHRKFSTKQGLRTHMKYSAKNKTCALTYTDRYKQNKHFYTRGKMCQICGKIVKSQFALHMLSHTTTKRFKCDMCEYRTNKSCLFRNHKFTHSGDIPFLCATCGKPFIQKYFLKIHLKQHEMLEKPIGCRYCEETFPTKYECLVHMQRHGVMRRGRPYIRIKTGKVNRYCTICDKTFQSGWHLRNHIIEKHDKIKGYFACRFCDMEFDTRTRLSNHILTQHVRKLDLTCKICDKSLKGKHLLEQHMNMHTGERPFQCDLCPSKFRSNSNLYTHNFIVHEDRRPFPCEVCKKAFRTAPTLREHARTHTGERLSCEHCDKTFAGNSNRCKHMREVHNIRSYTRS